MRLALRSFVVSAFVASVLVPTQASASLIALSGNARVSASGSARSSDGTTDSYALTESILAPFNIFDGNVSGVVHGNWTPPADCPNPMNTGCSFPTAFSAHSSAIQYSTFESDGITSDGMVSAGYSATFLFPTVRAGYLFDVTFSVDQLMTYDLSVSGSFNRGRPMNFVSQPFFALTQLDGGLSLDWDDVRAYSIFNNELHWDYHDTGFLEPGDYRLFYSAMDLQMGFDPFGDAQQRTFHLDLQAQNVPDTGTTAAVIIAIASLIAARRWDHSKS